MPKTISLTITNEDYQTLQEMRKQWRMDSNGASLSVNPTYQHLLCNHGNGEIAIWMSDTTSYQVKRIGVTQNNWLSIHSTDYMDILMAHGGIREIFSYQSAALNAYLLHSFNQYYHQILRKQYSDIVF